MGRGVGPRGRRGCGFSGRSQLEESNGAKPWRWRRDGERLSPAAGSLAPDSDLPIDAERRTWPGATSSSGGTEPERHDAALAATFQRAVDLGLTLSSPADPMERARFQGRKSEVLLGGFLGGNLCRPLRAQAGARSPGGWVETVCPEPSSLAAAPGRKARTGWMTGARPATAPWQEGPLLEGLADLVDRQEVASLRLVEPGGRAPGADPPAAGRPWQIPRWPACRSSFPCSLRRRWVAEVLPPRRRRVAIAYTPLALGCSSDPAAAAAWPVPGRGVGSTAGCSRIEPLLVEDAKPSLPPRASEWPEVALKLCPGPGAPAQSPPLRNGVPGERQPRQSRGAGASSEPRWELSIAGDRPARADCRPPYNVAEVSRGERRGGGRG